MKFKSLLAILATVSVALAPALRAEDDTPLAKQMSAMNKSLRTLKRQLGDTSKKDENLGLLGKIKANIAESLKLQPKKTKDVPEAEKTAYLEKYKQQLNDLTKSFETMEAAIKAGKTEEAQAVFEKLSEQKEKGHKDFGADDE